MTNYLGVLMQEVLTIRAFRAPGTELITTALSIPRE
jgi:hypothetical protein